MTQRRYPKVPFDTSWQHIDDCDLMPQGDPETVVFLPKHKQLLGLYIRGMNTHAMLGVSMDGEGRPDSCAIVNEIGIQLHVQSNPRRHHDDTDGA
jgi:hypothetical protein